MKYLKLQTLRDRLYFSCQDVAETLGIKHASALVLCSRYVDNGLFIRLKKDFYTIKEKWRQNSITDFFSVSNILQVPSYVSLLTALCFYEVTTQVQRDVFEAICIKSTARYEIEGVNFNFYKLKRELYFDFVRQDNFFVASKEKAFLDAMYLCSFAKYSLDISSIDLTRFDYEKIQGLLKFFPKRTKQLVQKTCNI